MTLNDMYDVQNRIGCIAFNTSDTHSDLHLTVHVTARLVYTTLTDLQMEACLQELL